MDGVVGLSQCAISPGETFTYQFRIDAAQSGTFWYHAHAGMQRGDGLYGGLVVHQPFTGPPATYERQPEQLLLVGDWYHRRAGALLAWFQSSSHFGYEVRPVQGRSNPGTVPSLPFFVNCLL